MKEILHLSDAEMKDLADSVPSLETRRLGKKLLAAMDSEILRLLGPKVRLRVVKARLKMYRESERADVENWARSRGKA